MRADLISFKPIYSTFLTCDKDVEKILKALFVTSKPYSDILKRLLIINNKDCLDTSNEKYQTVIDNMTLKDMIGDDKYIRLTPKIARGTHEDIKSYILVSFDGFTPNKKSAHYKDFNINFDIVCYNDAWTLDDYKVRPIMIMGYIDGILNSLTNDYKKVQKTQQSQIKLSGIGEYQFLGANEVVLNEDISMYTLSYHGINFTESIKQIGITGDD